MPTYAELNRDPAVTRRTLIEIYPTDPSTNRDAIYTTTPGASPVLRFCDQGSATTGGPLAYGGYDYYPTIVPGSFYSRSGGNAFHPKMVDADCGFSLKNVKYIWQDIIDESTIHDVKLSQLFSQYIWQGAEVIVYSLLENHIGEQAVGQLFSGELDRIVDNGDTIAFIGIESKQYSAYKPDGDGPGIASVDSASVVTLKDWPNAPPDSIGKTLPLIYTDDTSKDDLAEDELVSNQFTNLLTINPKYLTTLFPCVVTDARYEKPSSDDKLLKVYLGGYPTQTAPNPATNLYMWFPEVNDVGLLNITGTGGSVDSRHHELWPNQNQDVRMFVRGSQLQAKTSGVTNEGRAFDGKKTSWATITSTAGTETLDIRLREMPNLGRITGIQSFLFLDGTGTGVDTGAGSASVNGDFGMWNASTAAYHFSRGKDITKSDIDVGPNTQIDGPAWSASEYSLKDYRNWQWSGGEGTGAPQDTYFRVRISTNGVTCHVIGVGIRITFVPRQFQNAPARRLAAYDLQGRPVR